MEAIVRSVNVTLDGEEQIMSEQELRRALEDYVKELEAPVTRAAIYLGPEHQAMIQGEDNEREVIAARLRTLLHY